MRHPTIAATNLALAIAWAGACRSGNQIPYAGVPDTQPSAPSFAPLPPAPATVAPPLPTAPAPAPAAPARPAGREGFGITQEPVFSNFIPLGFAKDQRSGELALALVSISGQTDPARVANRDELNMAYVNEKADEVFVQPERLKTIVLGDLMAARDARYAVFRFTIVMDESRSIDDTSLEQIRALILRFLEKIPRSYRAQIIRFGRSVVVATPFTNDPTVLRQALSGPRLEDSWYTAFFDGVDEALKQLEAGDEPLKFCVAFTDGKDNRSQRFGADPGGRAAEFRARIGRLTRDRSVPLFIGGVGKEVDSSLLEGIARSTLGLYLPVQSTSELSQLFDTVQHYLTKTYVFVAPILPGFENPRMIYILRGDPARRLIVQDIPVLDGTLIGPATTGPAR